MGKSALTLVLSVIALSLTGCGVIYTDSISEPYPSATIETESPKTVVSPDDERYKFINQMADELDYKSAGKVLNENRQDGTSHWLTLNVQFEDNDETFQILKEKVKTVPQFVNGMMRGCQESNWKEDTTLTCQRKNITVTLERNKTPKPEILFEIRDSDNSKWKKKWPRELTHSPMVKGHEIGYNVANSEITDRCTWDKGSDGKPELVDIPCELETFDDDGSSEAKMTVTVTDVEGKKYVLNSEVPVLDPAIIDQIVGGMVGSK